MAVGPKLTVTKSCQGCKYCLAELDVLNGFSYTKYRCFHKDTREKYIGTALDTPDWCPVDVKNKRWVNEEIKPVPGIPVLIHGTNSHGKGRVLRACWIPKYYREEEGDYAGDCDYSEEKDMYYWPEGWYEWNGFEEAHWLVDLSHIVWRSLPSPEEDLLRTLKFAQELEDLLSLADDSYKNGTIMRYKKALLQRILDIYEKW